MCDAVNATGPTESLQSWFSKPRMSRYMFHDSPAELYSWNSRLTKAFLEDIEHVEVLLRNRVDRTLQQPYGASWFDHDNIPFTKEARKSIRRAKQRTGQTQDVLNPDKIIAELPFDFWYYLFTPTYTATIWPRFAKSMAVKISREDFRATLEVVYRLRNRCAHHEPIVREVLQQEQNQLDRYQKAIADIANWIEPPAAFWIYDRSRVELVRSNRP